MKPSFFWTVSGFMVLGVVVGQDLRAQQTSRVTVEETGGIRRTQFPTRALIEVPRGQLEAAESIRLMAGDTQVPAQGLGRLHWEDGSVRSLEIDFNVSIGPLETRRFELVYGPDTAVPAARGRGLSVSEDADAVQAGRMRFGKRGAPLLLSVDYRGELIIEGRNGLAVVDDAGVRYDPSEIEWSSVELLKGGPLTVHLRYEGTVDLSRGSRADVTLDVEMPSSKSWVRISALVSDPDRRVRAVAIETPLRLGEYPWTWDFGTPNGTYGVFRNPTGSVVLTQTIAGPGYESWVVLAGPAGEERPYERSAPDRPEIVRGWAHFQNETQAVAFAIEGLGETAGKFTVTLTGEGQTSFGFAPAAASTEHSLTIYEHFVGTPVPIGAATSPASILSPLRVRVEALPERF